MAEETLVLSTPFRSARTLAADAWRLARFGRIERLRRATGGMLETRTYRALYKAARAAPDLDMVEIGAASGTGTIALAWGYRDQGHRSRILAVEKCEGGSRTRLGGHADNLAILTGNLARFGVSDTVHLFTERLDLNRADDVYARIQTDEIAGFIHDADGRLDRDFTLFWERTVPGGLIVVDDYDDLPQFCPFSDEWPDGGTKMLTTYRLLNKLIDWGLFAPERTLGRTVFGRKPVGATFAAFSQARCDEIVAGIMAERAAALGEDG